MRSRFLDYILILFVLTVGGYVSVTAQTQPPAQTPNPEDIIKRAIAKLGGDRYLQVKTEIGRGEFTTVKDGESVAFQTFVDAIVFPDHEWTEFKNGKIRTVQVNTGDTGWVYDGDQDLIKLQNDVQIGNFKRGLRTSLDNLLRGYWKGTAALIYIGRRPSTLGKRNDVIGLNYNDGLKVEFEFADDGTPMKAIYKRKNLNDEDVTEEDRYAQFVDIDGVKTPFIIDRFSNGAHSSRINFDSVEFNKDIPASNFAKPATPKDLRKGLDI